MSLAIKVIPTLDSRSVDTTQFEQVKVYDGMIENEVEKPAPQRCFGGAWYHKVLSSKDAWLGIEGVITLGEFTPDKDRFDLDGRGRYMDNPSVYMGGKADFESDAGLGFNTGYLDSDTSKPLDVYKSPKVAWRPFWRYIYSDALDHEGNVLRRNFNSWNISDPKNLQYYYLPGDKIRMSVFSPIKDYMQLRIEVLEVTTIPKYVAQRKAYHLKDDRPSDFHSPIFHSRGQGASTQAEFKRVNSIDQYGNEGKVAQITHAKVSEALWHEVYLYRKINGELVKVPFTSKRRTTMTCPNPDAFTVNDEGLDETLGAERVQIHPINCK
jgi:hypothetical protein